MKVFCLITTVVFALCGFAAAQDVHVDYDHHLDFSQYHTYSWAKIHTDNPLWERRIQDAVDKELQTKGWQRTEGNGQVAISAVGAVKDQQEYRTFYNGMGGWRWGGFGPEATTTVEDERVGTLVMDFYDSSNKQLIWRGVATDTLSQNPEKNENRLNKTTEKMLKNFPPKG